jgi:hypothetical protein
LKQYGWLANTALLTIAIIVVIGPLTFILANDIWWPAAMGRENYSLFFTAYTMMENGYFFARNAFFYNLFLAYPATVINSLIFKLFPQVSDFERFGAFGITMYVIYAVAVIVVCARVILSKSLLFGEKVMLLWVALGCVPLTFLLRNFADINYHLVEALLYTVCADMTIRWLWSNEPPKRSTIWIAGGLVAFAVGVKLTFVVTMAPYFLFFCLTVPGDWRQWIRPAAEFCLSGAICGAIMLLAYLHFHVQYVSRFFHDLTSLNTDSGWLVQHIDALEEGLRHGLEPGSVVFGFCVLFVVLFCTALTVLFMRDRVNMRGRLFILASVNIGLFFILFTYLRLAANTFTDFITWMLFVLAVMTSMLMRRSQFRWAPILQTAVLFYACAVNTHYLRLGLPEAIKFWKSQGDAGEAVGALIEQDPMLPIVYYLADNPGMIYKYVFPNPDLITVFSGDRKPIEDLYMKYARPRVSFAMAGIGIREGAQIAVVPEKISGVELTDLASDFRQSLSSPNCSSVNWGDDGIRGRSRVTVCLLR